MRLFILSTLLLCCASALRAQCTVDPSWCTAPPVVNIECVCDVPVIEDVFRDVVSNANEDVITYETVFPASSVITTGNCGEVYITAFDNVHHPTDCMDSFYIERVYSIRNNFQTINNSCVQRFVTDIAPGHFTSRSQPTITVSCAENTDSLFIDYIANNGYAEIAGNCNNNYTVSISPGYEFLQPMSPTCNSSAFTQPQFTLSDLICTPKCEQKFINDPAYALFFEASSSIGPRIFETTISRFEILDTIKPVFVTCPPNTVFDLGDPSLFDDIRDLLSQFVLDPGCTTTYPININPLPDIPTVQNNFDSTQIRLDTCDIQNFNYTLTATDNCDNMASCQVEVQITNEVGPLITFVPDTLFLECGDLNNQAMVDNWKAMLRAEDYLGNSISPSNIVFDFDSAVLTVSNCAASYNITFTVFDVCQRTATVQSIIKIDDTESPFITSCPTDTVVTADDPVLVQQVEDWLGGFHAQDICKPDFLKSNNFDLGLLTFNCGTIDTLVTFMADDSCSDPSTCTANLTILDNVTYEFINFPNDTTILCQSPVNTTAINEWISSTMGRSSLGTLYSNVQTDIDFQDPRLMSCNDVIAVLFFFENDCGIRIERTANLGIIDDQAPQVTCPSNASFSGDFDVIQPDITAWLGLAIPIDNCSASVINNFSNILFQDCTLDTITQTIQFFAQDDCGLVSQPCSADLTIISEKRPIISCPSPLILECGTENMKDSIQSWINLVNSTNFVGEDLPFRFTLDITTLSLVECLEQTMVTFTVDDVLCQRSNECETSITIQDTQRPNITCPPNLTVNSTGTQIEQEIDDWLALVLFDDNDCSDPTLFVDPTLSNIDYCTQTDDLTVTFRVVDMCLLERACVSIVSFNTSAPQITCPANNLMLECGDNNNLGLIQDWLTEPGSVDNSGLNLSAFITNDFDSDDLEINCLQTLAVRFEVADNCMVTNACSQNIIVTDTQAPWVVCPTIPLNLLAGDTTKIPKFLNWLDLLQVGDCNGYTVTSDFDSNLLAGFDCDEIDYDLTIIVTDDCGSTTDCQAMISIQNNITTTFINCDPAVNNLTVECGAPGTQDELNLWLSSVTAVDIFDNEFPTIPSLDASDPELLQCNATIPVTFELSDQCGQTQSCALSVTVIDNLAPVAICPGDTAFVLEDPNFDNQVSDWLNLISGNDFCHANLDFDNNYQPILDLPDCVAEEEQSVRFTLTDACGNVTSCSSTLTVRTISVPRITCPGNQIIECGDPEIDLIINTWLGTVAGVDSNDEPLQPVFNFDIDDVNNINCDGEVSILFQIEDDCNIQDSCRASIIIEDTTAPTATCPDGITINSTDPNGPLIMQDWIDSYLPLDNCSAATGSIMSGVIVPSIFCNSSEEMNIEFYAEDACGMRDTCETMIIVNKAAPVINCDADIEIECGATDNEALILDWIASIKATDNNAQDLDVISDYSPTTLDGECDIRKEVQFRVPADLSG